MACHSDPDRLARHGRVAPRNASATLALRTLLWRTHIPVPAKPIRAGAEQQLPELIHHYGIIYSFGSSVSCVRRLRVARVRPDLSYADVGKAWVGKAWVGKAWVSVDRRPGFKNLSNFSADRVIPAPERA